MRDYVCVCYFCVQHLMACDDALKEAREAAARAQENYDEKKKEAEAAEE